MRKGGFVPALHWQRLFLKDAATDVKLLAVYLMTCSHSTLGGVVRAAPEVMAADLRMQPRMVVDLLRALERRHFVVPYDPAGVTIGCDAWAVPAILDAEPIFNGNVGKRVAKDLGDMLDGGSGKFWCALWVCYRDRKQYLPEGFFELVERRAQVQSDEAGETVAELVVAEAALAPDKPAILERDPALELLAAYRRLFDIQMVSDAGSLPAELRDAAADRVAQLGGVDKIPWLMEKIGASDALMGRPHPVNGKVYPAISFGKLCGEAMFTRIVEGGYDNPPASGKVGGDHG